MGMRLNPCAANARNSASVIMRQTSLDLLLNASSAKRRTMRRFEADATKSRQDPMRHRRAGRQAEKPRRSNDIVKKANGRRRRKLWRRLYHLARRARGAAHRVDRRAIVALREDRAARNERVGARRGDRTDVVRLHAAIDFEQDLAPGPLDRAVDELARGANLLERMRNERLAAEAGIE